VAKDVMVTRVEQVLRREMYEFGDDVGNVACPQCGYEYSHIREAGTYLGSDQHEAGIYRGTSVLGVTGERRSAIVILFEGECGHKWEWRIQQHKGINVLLVAQRPADDVSCGGDG
jgi:hypothetical protein